jgi:hypothetical protein
MQTEDLGEVARTSGVTTAATKFDADLGSAFKIRAIGIVKHNMTLSATIRIYADDEATFTSPPYDPGSESVYPTFYPAGAELWGEDVGSTALSAADYAAGRRLDFFHLPSSAQNYRYWRVEITDTGNSDGYIEIGRLVIVGGYTPTVNYRQGAKFGYVSRSRNQETWGGRIIHDVRAPRRRFDFSLPEIAEMEALVQVLEVNRAIGTSEQFLMVMDQADSAHLPRRAFLSTLREIDPFEVIWGTRYGQPFSAIEVL